MPAAIARRVYAERRARVIDLATSPAVLTLLGLTPDVDTLEALPGEANWRVVALEQRHRGALVRGARIALNIAGDGISIASIVSTAQPDLAPPEEEIAPDEAVARALEVAPELSSIPLTAREYPPPFLVVREPAMFGGARRATEVRRGNDQLVYAVRLTSDDVVAQQVADVWVDAASGQISRIIQLASHSSSGSTKPIGKAITAGQAAFQNALIPLWLCLYNEGEGLDTDLGLRRFSTTYYPKEQNPWALVSCNEWGTPDRLVGSQDVVTFRDSPLVDPKFDQADVFRDADNSWISNDPLIRHAVNGQYWGERALRYFKKNGYTKRVGSNIPVRYVGWQRGYAEQAWFTRLNTSLGTDNGVIQVGVGGERFKTSADPMVLAHELGHSLWEDVLPRPADKTEEKAIYEGLSDCFAMAAMNDMQQEWLSDPANSPPHPGYQDLGTHAAFSFWAGSYLNEDTAQLTPGYPDVSLRACGLERDGTLSCWPTAQMNSVGAFPPGHYSTVSTLGMTACAVRLDGTLACWGNQGHGLDDPPPGKFQDVAVGGMHACAIRADGTLACWGANYNGQANPPAGTFVQITSGSHFSCARNIDNVVACWGFEESFGNLHGRLARSVHAGGRYNACVIELDGTLTCVGVQNEELIRPPAGRFVQMDVGFGHACALRADHSIACWGSNTYGESTPPAR